MREKILALLHGKKKVDTQPAFSGLIHVTAEGLASEGLAFNEICTDALKMASAAASTFKLTGMPSAALPLDLCAPAEMLGAELRYYPEEEFRFPQVGKVQFESTEEITTENTNSTEILEMGRARLICDAIQLVKQDVGKDIVISGMLPGPFTLLLYVCRPKNVFIEIKKNPEAVSTALFHLSSFLAKVGQAYLNAGADFITLHEMGGSPGFIGPKPFESHILPALQKLTGELPRPSVISVCGKTDAALSLLTQTGADAVSIDQMTDLTAARAVLKGTLLFGNLDPVRTLSAGDKAEVVEDVQRAKEAGVDAVWPGCDLVVQTPTENLKAIRL
ncbi:MAG: uroporphyrinogen decarboxylase family protein [Anaerolineales bacterium]|nr:MAG: uroporphyrinogen decarboxylase family protein [Anaerolineales bacterium]